MSRKTVVQCDRCARVIETPREPAGEVRSVVADTYPAPGMRIDLCARCYTDLRDWLRMLVHLDDGGRPLCGDVSAHANARTTDAVKVTCLPCQTIVLARRKVEP